MTAGAIGEATEVPASSWLEFRLRESKAESRRRSFEIVGHLAITDASLSRGSLHTLDQKFCRQSGQGTLNVDVSELGDGEALVNWMDSYVRYGHAAWENFVVSVRDPQLLAELRVIQPALRTGLILDDGNLPVILDSLAKPHHGSSPDCVLTSLGFLSMAFQAREYRPALKVLVRFAQSPFEAFSAMALGADGVVTNHPFRLRNALAKAG